MSRQHEGDFSVTALLDELNRQIRSLRERHLEDISPIQERMILAQELLKEAMAIQALSKPYSLQTA